MTPTLAPEQRALTNPFSVLVHRVLVTGSRRWTDRALLWAALDAQIPPPGRIMVLVHGGAPGADSLAHEWALHRGIAVERYPADWPTCAGDCRHPPRRTRFGDPFCPLAGHRRNQYMVDLGADVCLGFLLPDSTGTRDCIRRAEKAHIPVIRH